MDLVTTLPMQSQAIILCSVFVLALVFQHVERRSPGRLAFLPDLQPYSFANSAVQITLGTFIIHIYGAYHDRFCAQIVLLAVGT
jgi:hypothetical protein